MYRFSEVAYDGSTETADVGTGLVWDDVYAALEPYAVNVVGGRVPGVGVAGFTLGGGMAHHFYRAPSVIILTKHMRLSIRLFLEDQSIWIDRRQRACL